MSIYAEIHNQILRSGIGSHSPFKPSIPSDHSYLTPTRNPLLRFSIHQVSPFSHSPNLRQTAQKNSAIDRVRTVR